MTSFSGLQGSQKHALDVFPSCQLVASDGVNRGDCLGWSDTLALGDIYVRRTDSVHQALSVEMASGHPDLRVLPCACDAHCDCAAAHAGNTLEFDCRVTFMTKHGCTAEAIVIAEIDLRTNRRTGGYVFPLGEMPSREPMALIAIDHHVRAQQFLETANATITAEMVITLADGRQEMVKNISKGDLVMTRDHGPRPIRWIAAHIERGMATRAPIRISAGVLGNTRPIVVSPNCMISFEHLEGSGGARERLMRADRLINGTTVQRMPVGVVEYFQILFDQPETIYLNDIPVRADYVPHHMDEDPAPVIDFTQRHIRRNALAKK